MEPSNESLEKLAHIAAELNQETEALKERITNLEKRLGKMRIGVSVWLDETVTETAEAELAGSGYCIGYTKIKDKWRIAARRCGSDSDDAAMPLTKAPRLVRVQGVDQLGALVDALIVKAETFLEHIKNKKAVETDEAPAASDAEQPVLDMTSIDETTDHADAAPEDHQEPL